MSIRREGPLGYRTPFIAAALAHAYAPEPAVPFYEWAETHVWLEGKDAAEPGFYRSAKTPWTRRVQRLDRDPCRFAYDFRAAAWVRVACALVAVKKSSRTGFTEACFNGLRFRSAHRPINNYIIAIDTDKQARFVCSRVKRSLRDLRNLEPHQRVFTGDPDDVRTSSIELPGMLVEFYGSGSPGNFANKPAARVLIDELDEHMAPADDTDSVTNLKSRIKDAKGGLVFVISKPKLEDGPIDKVFKTGNCEEFFVPCPHCGTFQPITFDHEELETDFDFAQPMECRDGEWLPVPLPQGSKAKLRTGRLVFDHCKYGVTGEWDLLALSQGQAYYECSSQACREGPQRGIIAEHHKAQMAAQGRWIPLRHGDPAIVSQHANDLLSAEAKSTWGEIIKEFLVASKAGPQALQGWLNNRLGKTRKVEASNTTEGDIIKNIAGREPAEAKRKCPPYQRGLLPFRPKMVLLGADVGLDYCAWAVGAVHENLEDIALIDWGTATGPDALAELLVGTTYPLAAEPHRKFRIHMGFIDAKFRKPDVRKACLSVMRARGGAHNLVPTSGLGGSAARRTDLSYGRVPNMPPNFKHLTYRDSDAKTELYVTVLARQHRRLWFPVDVMNQVPGRDDPDFFLPEQLCQEKLIVAPGQPAYWKEEVSNNHLGDAVKEIVVGRMMLTRLQAGTLDLPDTASS